MRPSISKLSVRLSSEGLCSEGGRPPCLPPLGEACHGQWRGSLSASGCVTRGRQVLQQCKPSARSGRPSTRMRRRRQRIPRPTLTRKRPEAPCSATQSPSSPLSGCKGRWEVKHLRAPFNCSDDVGCGSQETRGLRTMDDDPKDPPPPAPPTEERSLQTFLRKESVQPSSKEPGMIQYCRATTEYIVEKHFQHPSPLTEGGA